LAETDDFALRTFQLDTHIPGCEKTKSAGGTTNSDAAESENAGGGTESWKPFFKLRAGRLRLCLAARRGVLPTQAVRERCLAWRLNIRDLKNAASAYEGALAFDPQDAETICIWGSFNFA